jgi:tetratricopeptide (TPR) repeat protein
MAAKQAKWNKFEGLTYGFDYEGPALKKNWARLHRGDCESFPDAAYLKKIVDKHPGLKPKKPNAEAASTLQDAWRAYHRGDFHEAFTLGQSLGPLGANVANKAENIQATYLELDKETKLAMFLDVVHRGEELQKAAPDLANGWYLYAQALGRYGQGISVAKALAEGLGGKVKGALERAIELEPKHADANIALGAYHANVVHKIGGLGARLTYGASKEAAVDHFQEAVKLNPGSAVARIEYANGLAMLFGKSKLAEATKLYEEAAECEAADAMEWLDVELAKSEIAA